jgi:hypothetical protein
VFSLPRAFGTLHQTNYYATLAQCLHWLMLPAMKKEMSVIDCARFMALVAVAAADAGIAVLDAKYHYDFWRPMTAIRNGDIDDNPATERERDLAANRQHADASRISARTLHRQRRCGGGRRGRTG